MKRIYLLEVSQHKTKRYVGCTSAKDLVRLATKVELQTEQAAQRPINPKRLEAISSFVLEDGTLSTSIVIGTKDTRINVYSAKKQAIPTLYYMDFPESEEEFKDYENCFDILDGQHRLFSFLPQYSKLSDDEVFDITFEMYIQPTMREKRIIFKNTNEKQEKVASNLLMWFREKLNMLTGKEQTYHPVVSLLNSEECSPLKGRIIMGSEKIIGGFKAQQLITILDKSDIKNIAGNNSDNLDNEKMLRLISAYLAGWENAVGIKISDRNQKYGPFSKIAGIRFMILMLPSFFEQAIRDHALFTKDYVTKKINALFDSENLKPKDTFDKKSN